MVVVYNEKPIIPFVNWKTDWAPSLTREISLAGAVFEILGWTVDPLEHPWAGVSDFEGVYNECMAMTNTVRKIGIYFHSPATFRVQGNNYPLPDPKKVFLNLLNKWNTYSPINLGDNFTDFIESCVYPSAYNLQTRIMHFDRYKQVGFTGTCSFAIKKQDDDVFARVIHMLGRFIFYAGVGYKTTMGMGQARMAVE